MREGTSCPTSAQAVLDILACWSPIARWGIGRTPDFAAHIHRLIQRLAMDLVPTKASCRIGQEPMIRGLGDQTADVPLEEGMHPLSEEFRCGVHLPHVMIVVPERLCELVVHSVQGKHPFDGGAW